MLRRAAITPTFNKDDILDRLIYRPISITTLFSKILEKYLHKQIKQLLTQRIVGCLHHFNLVFDRKLLLKMGFCVSLKQSNTRSKLTIQYMLSYLLYQKHLTHFHTKFFSRNFSCYIFRLVTVHAVLLVISKAFDSVSHQILLKKLQSLHFSPSAIQIVESFFSGRLQQVSVSGVQTEWIELKQGVHQGTVIGPLFFNLYVNDLPELMSETDHILQFADDCSYFVVINNPRLLLKY